MKSKIISMAAIALTFSVSSAKADDFSYQGSDYLINMIGDVLATRACGDIRYLGDGSSAGARAILAGAQQTAPMIHALGEDFCSEYADAALQIAIGVEDVVISRNNAGSPDFCDTRLVAELAQGSAPGSSSEEGDWREVLQLVYGGEGGLGTLEACTSNRRRELIENWSKLWDNPCSLESCGRLRFAFRPRDGSLSARIFRKYVGVEKFCNGDSFQDQDPLRTDCLEVTDVDYCDPKRSDYPNSLGVVQPIVRPPDELLGASRCDPGRWDFAFTSYLTDELFDGKCPDESPPLAGFLCLYPMDCAEQFGCANFYDNPSPLQALMDGRIYNLLRSRRSEPELPFDLVGLEGETLVLPEAYFFRGDCMDSGKGRGLEETASSKRIGCLVNQVDCSISFTKKSQLNPELRNWRGSGSSCGETRKVINVAASVDGKSHGGLDYPMRQNIYLAAVGIPTKDGGLDCDAISNPEERTFCRCIFEGLTGASTLRNALDVDGWEPYPGGPKIFACGDTCCSVQ